MTRAHKTHLSIGSSLALTPALFALLGVQIVASGGPLSAAGGRAVGHNEKHAALCAIPDDQDRLDHDLPSAHLIRLGLIIHWSCGVLAFIATLAVVWFVVGRASRPMDNLHPHLLLGPGRLMKANLTASAMSRLSRLG